MQNLQTQGAKVVEQRGEIEKIPRHLLCNKQHKRKSEKSESKSGMNNGIKYPYPTFTAPSTQIGSLLNGNWNVCQ